MTSNVAYERSFAELSNGHEFSMVRVITLAKIIKTICSVFFIATVRRNSVIANKGNERKQVEGTKNKNLLWAEFR